MGTAAVLLTAGASQTASVPEQVITMVSVLGVFGAILVFLVKHMFNQITGGINQNNKGLADLKDANKKEISELAEDLRKQIQQNNKELTEQIKQQYEKVNERIDRLESRTEGDIANIKKEIGDIKGDFATSFVLREDFFRSMNGVENNMRDMNGKMDRILMQLGEKGK